VGGGAHLVDSGTLAVCFALAVAAGMALEAWADRRGARFAAAHGILSRADVIVPTPVRVVPKLRHAQTDFGRPALEAAPQTVITGGTHIWLAGLLDEGQAAAIRKALTGQAGDANPGHEDETWESSSAIHA
jgi:hypothetical protein